MEPLSCTIVIPTYNRARLIGRAVASALAAAGPGDEVVVVDDGSTDDTEAALRPYLPRIRYLRTANGGAGAARNRGIREARTPLVAFLDSDDEWLPDKLHLQRALLACRPDVLFCFSDFGGRFDTGGERHGELARWHRDPRGWDAILGPGTPFSALAPLPPGRADFLVHVGNIYLAEMERSYIATSTVVVRRAAGDALRFAEDLPLAEDWECFARLARVGAAAYLDCETSWHWRHRNPRLTNASPLVYATAFRTVLERNWGQDEGFLAAHGDRYARALAVHHRNVARWLVQEGRAREARAELRQAVDIPLDLRLLAALPDGPLPKYLSRGYRAVRRIEALGGRLTARLRALRVRPEPAGPRP
jgi:glycosyltransferase involved in cell wall biosynthesis